ncbi:uncharacterized protein LOC116300167 isoform X2 [Actinia tenebrosa]|uniref:Uncharacterized protein LOC116300167 isoform X2 n=1 Tax=Actinia tenebrosa TaxID=6105 RepID=A0A6P8IE24_ACTTE|nr:uncharacterized protein LOC116300167 isoform X2 [Actinia tenebrosa]
MLTSCMVVKMSGNRYKGSLDRRKLQPFHGAIPARIYSHPPLYPGEQIIFQQDHIVCVDSFDSHSEGVLHLTTFRIIFTGNYCKELYSAINDKNSMFDEDAEELSKKGSRRQSVSSKSVLANNQKNHSKPGTEVYQRQQILAKCPSPLKYSQSVKKRSNTSYDVAGLDDPNTPKLMTYRPLVLSNLEHIKHVYDLELSIPCTSIYDIRKYSKKNLPKGKSIFLCDGFEILCNNIKSHRFCIGLQSCYDADSIIKLLTYHAKPTFSRLFAFAHKSAIIVPRKTCSILESRDAPNFYKFNDEYIDRLGLLSTNEWKVPSHVCEHYPMRTLVPSTITDVDLKNVANFHRNDCYPAVCWKHKKNGSVMLRSAIAITRRGLLESRCEHDETFLNSVCQINQYAAKNKLVVFSEQPKQSGAGLLNTPTQRMNDATGQLTPEQGETFYYANCKFVYVDTAPDFKAIRQSAFKLQTFLASTIEDSKYLTSLEETEWLSQISELIQTGTQAAVAMDCDRSSVLFSYGDGFDRTAQLTSLTQLLLDPYYRTFDGFQILIQKEWMAFAHRFVDRTLPAETPDEHGPVFLQFLDCVWQITQQFPFSFEFNSSLIETIAESAYSCRFGDFLANSDYKKKGVHERSASLWTWLNVASMSDPDRFTNPRYRPNPSALFPRFNIPFLKIWTFYSSTCKQENVREARKAGQLQGLKLEETYKDLLDKFKLLRQKAECDTTQDNGLTNYPNPISNHVTFTVSDSSSSTDSINEEQSDLVSSLTSTLALDSYNSTDGVKPVNPERRMTRSRSLDDMLNVSNQTTLKRASLKRKVGGSKFYTERLLDELNREPRKRFVVPQPIQEKYNNLQEYLHGTGVNFSTENTVKITDKLCCGYLVKQGKIHKSWRKRWFVLDLEKKCLAYFESEKSQHPKGAINYQSIVEVHRHKRSSKKKKDFKFDIVTPERTYAIETPNEINMNIWLACLTIPPNAIEFG